MHISKTMHPNFTKYSARAACSCGSVFLWRRCNALCTSAFVNGVMIPGNGPYGGVTLPQQRRCGVVHGLTHLLHDGVRKTESV